VDTTVTEDGNLALGPFQAFWDAWSEADEEIKGKHFDHFSRAVGIQFMEMDGHLKRGERMAAAREATDVISIALNTLRWMQFEPAEIAKIARDRARDRMCGQTHAILEQYEKQHGC
jgi:hypothetical protein